MLYCKDLFLFILLRQLIATASFLLPQIFKSSPTLSFYRSRRINAGFRVTPILVSFPVEVDTNDDDNTSNQPFRQQSQTQPTDNMNPKYDGENTAGFSEDLGKFDPSKKIPMKREVLVGDPQVKVNKEKYNVTSILTELAAIQQQGPQKYCILGTRHCSYLHQQIIELL